MAGVGKLLSSGAEACGRALQKLGRRGRITPTGPRNCIFIVDQCAVVSVFCIMIIIAVVAFDCCCASVHAAMLGITSPASAKRKIRASALLASAEKVLAIRFAEFV